MHSESHNEGGVGDRTCDRKGNGQKPAMSEPGKQGDGGQDEKGNGREVDHPFSSAENHLEVPIRRFRSVHPALLSALLFACRIRGDGFGHHPASIYHSLIKLFNPFGLGRWRRAGPKGE
jgi:hypothetical protein